MKEDDTLFQQPQDESYINSALLAVHGSSVVYIVEFLSHVYSFELDLEGNVCTGSEYITDAAPGREGERRKQALAAAQKDWRENVTPRFDAWKANQGLRVVRDGPRSFKMLKQENQTWVAAY